MKKSPVLLIREEHNLNKKEFLERVGMSWQGLYNIETGKTINLQDRTLEKIQNAFGIDPNRLRRDYLAWQLENMSIMTIRDPEEPDPHG